KLGAGLQYGNAGALQALSVEALQPRDLGILVGDQRRPVEFRLRQAPAEACGVLEIIAEAAGVDEQLLGHAAADHAGAAEPIIPGHSELCAASRGTWRRPH